VSDNISWHNHHVGRRERALQKNQSPCLLWFTGLSASGKSTLSNMLDRKLYHYGAHCYLLDGDNVRHGLSKDLGFSHDDRVENIRRVGEVSKLFTDAGLIVMSAFISPYRSDRLLVRNLMPEGEFIEIFVDAPLEICEQRDPKGLYGKARRGEIKNFTGIDSEYEPPQAPEIHLETDKLSPGECVDIIWNYLTKESYLAQ
jgi:adenylyl-sulfate kinase